MRQLKQYVLPVILLLVLFSPLIGAIPDFSKYYHYDEFERMILELRSYENVRVEAIGKSWMNRTIYAIFIGNVYEKPVVLIVGGHHGREHVSAQFPLYYAYLLVTNESQRKLLDHYSFIIIPLLNPDGYEEAFKNPWHRKNCRPLDDDGDGLLDEDPPQDTDGDGYIAFFTNGSSYWFEGFDDDKDGKLNEDWIGGVDLNRNYPVAWDKGDINKFSLQYKGPAPLSEPETKALDSLVKRYRFCIVLAISYHSGARLVLYPWSHTREKPPREKVFREVCTAYSNVTKYPVLQSSRLYLSFGEFMDYMLYEYNITSITVEIFGRFMDIKWHREHTYRVDSTIVFKHVYEYFNPYPREELKKVLKINAIALKSTLLYYTKYLPARSPGITKETVRRIVLVNIVFLAIALAVIISDYKRYTHRLFK